MHIGTYIILINEVSFQSSVGCKNMQETCAEYPVKSDFLGILPPFFLLQNSHINLNSELFLLLCYNVL